jgi:hypothetical protein
MSNKTVTEQDIYKVFQNLYVLTRLFDTRGDYQDYGSLTFKRVAGNNLEPEDQELSKRFVVWNVGSLYIKIEGEVTSYGNRTVSHWSFATPKEKQITVYE